MELANALQPDRIFDIEDCAKDEETLLREFNDYITDDRVFGIMCHKAIDTWFESEKLETMKKAIETECAEEKDTNGGLIVIVGTATELLAEADLLVYCDLTRWEIQLRYRSGMPNWHSTNYNDPILTKYKRGFFIEWRLADRYKKERYEKFTYLLDTEKENAPVLTTGNAFRGALQQLARQPFRMEPYFDPGVWGGQWMKENFGLDASKENFAWSFDGVPEENSLNLEIGGKVLKVPAQDLVFYAPHELLGERVHGRFGAEFPIRFDLLDTMGGQNLSLQVHPLTEYIYEKFGMPYTQDESYYLLDVDEDEETYVYLGLKEGVDKKRDGAGTSCSRKRRRAFPCGKICQQNSGQKTRSCADPGRNGALLRKKHNGAGNQCDTVYFYLQTLGLGPPWHGWTAASDPSRPRYEKYPVEPRYQMGVRQYRRPDQNAGKNRKL